MTTGLLLLGEGSHDGAGDAVVVVVVFGDGVGGLAFEGRVGEGACVQAGLVELAGILRHIG